MHRLFLFSFFTLALAGLTSCGNSYNKASRALANQKSLDDFAFLVSNHPELGEATLEEIKTSAQAKAASTESTKSTNDIHFAIPASPEDSSVINPEIAKQAQSLIDDILDNFDFATQLSVTFKVTGIFLNMQKERLEQLESQANSFGDKGAGNFSKFDDQQAAKDMSCEAFMENPFTKIPKEKYDFVSKQNRERIKKTLSGCPKLVAQKFIQCIGDFNVITSLVDQYATCDLKSIDELNELLDKKTDGKFQQKGQAVQECLSVDFSSCGFELQKVSHN